uniref:Uncharacterized protein n=1 Tax=Anguilla anguilla TaxID=7936 RepID=A0A0E9TCE2_ANGAN
MLDFLISIKIGCVCWPHRDLHQHYLYTTSWM